MKTLGILIATLFMVGCGGGGGSSQTPINNSSSSSSSSTSTTTYEYDRIAGEYTNKVWDSVTIGRFLGNETYLTDYSYDAIAIITQNTNSYELEFSGTKYYDETSFNYNWILNDNNTSVTDLYDPTNPSVVMAQSGVQSFANVDVGIITYDRDYLAGVNIFYTDLGFVEIDYRDGAQIDSFVTAYGDATEIGDLPSSKSYNVTMYLLLQFWTDSGSTQQRVLASGDGTLDINFNTETIVGSMTADSYYDWDLWKIGGTDISQIFGIDSVDIAIANGQVDGGNILANIDIDHNSSDGTTLAGAGILMGTVFGPDADEIGLNFTMFENPDTDTQDVYFWDLFGGAIGQ